MKIVDVCAFYTPQGGGVRTYIDHKLRAAAAAGHEMTVIAPGPTTGIHRHSERSCIRYLASPRFPLDTNYRYFNDDGALHAALDREKPDIVEVSSPWRSAKTVAAWRGSAPRVLIMHADPLAAYAYRWFGPIARRETIDRQFDWFWERLRLFNRNFDLIVCASQALTDRLHGGGVDRAITEAMGVEAGCFSPSLRDEALRARMLERCELPEHAILLIGIGRHAPEKRWPMVIDAVTSAGLRHDVGLIILGDGRERSRLVRSINGNPHIQLLSPVTDRLQLAQLLASADALVHGCEAETYCMVAAEARASGIPIIVPDEGGAADHAREGVGVHYAATKAQAAAAAIDAHIGNIGALRAHAAARAADVRTMDMHFEALFARYETLRRRFRLAA